MERVTIKLYDFSELSEAAKAAARNNVRKDAKARELDSIAEDFGRTYRALFGALCIDRFSTSVQMADGWGLDEDNPRHLWRYAQRVIVPLFAKGGWPFTGVYTDEYARRALLDWPAYVRKGLTIADFVRDVFAEMHKGEWECEEYAESDACAEIYIESDGTRFLENGTVWAY